LIVTITASAPHFEATQAGVTWFVCRSALGSGAQLVSNSPFECQAFGRGPYAQSTDSIIVRGEVLRIVSAREEPLIVSYVTILVRQVVIGPISLPGTNIILRHLGGEVNRVLLWMSDQPYFAIGESVEVEVRQEGNIYVSVSPKKTLAPPSNVFATAAGYTLQWYKPGTGWQVSTTRPGADWYGPAKWSSGAFNYWINTANIPADVPASSFITYATASFQTWEDDPGSSIDFTYSGTSSNNPEVQDNTNVVGWGSIGGSTIARTTIWASYSTGDYSSLRITETDMKFDSSKLWSAQSSGVSGRYDVQNIGTHEAGHTFGLGDMYDSEDSEQTMYGYAGMGETKKRTLEWGDLAGVAALYPSAGYTVTFKTNPTSWSGSAGSITVDSSSTYTNSQTGSYTGSHNILANAPSSYRFHHWEYSGSSSSGVYCPNIGVNPSTMQVNGDGWIKAIFEAQITFYTTPSSGGSIQYGSSGTYTNGQTRWEANLPPDYSNTVTITANPPPGYAFSSWSVSGMLSVASSSSNPTTLTVNGPGTLTANFVTTQYTITVYTRKADSSAISGVQVTVGSQTKTTDSSGKAEFSALAGTYDLGVQSPSSGGSGIQYVFTGWTDGNTQNPRSITVSASVTYDARYKTQYQLTMQVNPVGGGTTTPAVGTYWYDSGQTVNIDASPNSASGYAWVSWTGSGLGSYSGTTKPTSITMNGPITETANFAMTVQITVTSSPTGSGFVTVDGSPITTPHTFTWIQGSTHTLAANSPASGGTGIQYVWVSWSDGGAQSHTITVPSSPTTYTANFKKQYMLTVSISPAGGGTLSVGSGWRDDGSSVQVTATANTGYSFYYWSLDGVNVGGSPSYSVLMNSPHSLTAFFRGTSTMSLGLSAGSIALGASVTLSGTITPAQPSPGIVVGTTITLSYTLDGATWNTFITTQTGSGGAYSVAWYLPYPGTYQIKATWSGNADYEGSTSSTVSLTVTGTLPPRIMLLVSGPTSTARGSAVTFDVLVTNPGSSISTTLYFEVVGPAGYWYFDTQQISVATGGIGRFQFTWQVPSIASAGQYQVFVGLIPPKTTAIAQTQITIT